MDSYRCTLAALLALLMGGCHGGVETELLERELRRQEDYIYQLQDQLDACEVDLESCCQRRDDSAAKADAEGPTPTPATSPGRRREADPQRDADQPQPPVIEQGIPFDPEADPGAGTAPPSAQGPEIAPEPSAVSTDGATQITLNAMLAEHQPASGDSASDEGIRAVIEPRTPGGQVVHVPGELAVMVLDTSPGGRQAQIARWDFTADEAAAHWQTSADGAGIHLDLPWPDADPPPHGRYQLWARLVTLDGKKLLTSLDMDVDTSGHVRQARRGGGDNPRHGDRLTARPAAPPRRQLRGWSRRQGAPESASAAPGRTTPLPHRPGKASGSSPAKPVPTPLGKAPQPVWKPYR